MRRPPRRARCTIRRARCRRRSTQCWSSCAAIDRSDRCAGAMPVAISERANTISEELNRTLARPTTTHEQQYQIASELYEVQRTRPRDLMERDVAAVEKELERLVAPYTPGRMPR